MSLDTTNLPISGCPLRGRKYFRNRPADRHPHHR
jgi:hypothetical protein